MLNWILSYARQKLGKFYEPVGWISFRMVTSKSKALLAGPSVVSFVGLVLGVSCLVVSMAVMSGFESTLQRSVADVTGHLRIRRQGYSETEWRDEIHRMKENNPEVVAGMPYGFAEGVLANKGKLSGVILQGVDGDHVNEVLSLKDRMVVGELKFPSAPPKDGMYEIFIGKGLADNFSLQKGDPFQIVFPLPTELDPSQFRRKIAKFRVAGILDLGKKDYDDRLLITNMSTLQKVTDTKSVSGVIIRVKNVNRAREVGFALGRFLGPNFQISDWREINENLFDAVELERIVVFLVIFIIVLASAFNVSSALYANVLKRYPEIGILKALGMSRARIVQIFSLQGVMLGAAGFACGLGLGLVFCLIFSWAEAQFGLLPTSVYRLDHIDLSVRGLDVFWIAVSTLTICFLATLEPAIRGSKLMPVEGLRHE